MPQAVAAAVGQLQHAPGKQRQGGTEADNPRPVERAGIRVARLRQRKPAGNQSHYAKQGAAEKNAVPAGNLHQHPGDHRSGGKANAKAGAEQAEGAGAPLSLKGIGQRGGASGQCRGGGGTLKGAHHVQPHHRRHPGGEH